MVETKLPTKSLEQFLSQKPLYYAKIDYERMPRTYHRIKEHLPQPKIIHLVGTNGKGTTGRFLAQALHSTHKTVGHYSSPHIIHFNERIWINGNDIDDQSLEKAHHHLQKLLNQEEKETLSYFEYTTLLAMVAFKDCEYVVLEAGLGGEKDATAVFPSLLTIATPIDFDHQDFLGSSIKEIATTKLNAAKNTLLLAKQPHPEVLEVAKQITQQKQIPFFHVTQFQKEQEAQEIATKLNLPNYLQENLQTALCALEILSIANYTINQVQLFGRLTQLRPNILIDVGHNPLAAQAIAKTLAGKKYTLIYNTFADKEYATILKILSPIIKDVEIIDIFDKRAVLKEELQKTLKKLKIKYSSFKTIQPEKKYLVFGSFSVIEEFLKQFND